MLSPFKDPILSGFVSCATISTLLLIGCIYCHRKLIVRNATHPVFILRRPYFVSYISIIISINMLLRAIFAFLLYDDKISIVMYRELFRFLAIFGEMLCLILRYDFCIYIYLLDHMSWESFLVSNT